MLTWRSLETTGKLLDALGPLLPGWTIQARVRGGGTILLRFTRDDATVEYTVTPGIIEQAQMPRSDVAAFIAAKIASRGHDALEGRF